MSGSSPEAGEWAARNRIGVGFAVTTVPLAKKAARHYREQAAIAGWEPTPDDVLYRLTAHLADTDEQAMEDLAAPTSAPSMRLSSMVNRQVMAAIAESGYHGRDVANQAGRVLGRHPLHEQIELGQTLAGSPETVVKQIQAIKQELDCGILDISLHPTGRDKMLRAIELFGTQVLPRIRDL
jgi:alkanesulfonate monooxygenase SsuD/methylene tetrahydromethanopterin reductase-like flavin-dependent oxidoreductase (luciferase family)